MAGIAAAHQLAVRAGLSRIVLVDPRDPLSLTSSKGTEAYRNYWPGPDDTMARFMDHSIDLLEELDRDSRQAFELNRRGYVFLTADVAEAERLSAFAKATADKSAFAKATADRHAGPPTDFVGEPRTILQRYPFITDRVRAMLHVRRAGFMNASKLGQHLLKRSCARGIEVIRDEVAGLVVENGRFVAATLASGLRIDAPVFVLAAGPLLPEWTDRIGLEVPIRNEL